MIKRKMDIKINRRKALIISIVLIVISPVGDYVYANFFNQEYE